MDKSIFLAWWRVIRTVAIALSLLLSFIAAVEVLRVYLILSAFSPWLGFGFLALLASGVVWVVSQFFAAWWSLPRAPIPPQVSDPYRLSHEEARACAGFLQHRIRQLRENPRLSFSEQDPLAQVLKRLDESPDQENVTEIQAHLTQILRPLDRIAEGIVQTCVRDIMLAVVLSPYRSADLLVVIYRNSQMILQLAQLYQTRPAPIEQLRILKDVLTIVATVNFLNFAEKFIEQLSEQVPLVGQLMGDMSQGFGAGLLTSAAGHAAIERCKSVGPWNRTVAQQHLAQRMSRFAGDVKEIFRTDVLPKLRPRLPNLTGVWDKISAAFDTAVDGMSEWTWRPVTTRSSAFAAATPYAGAVQRGAAFVLEPKGLAIEAERFCVKERLALPAPRIRKSRRSHKRCSVIPGYRQTAVR